MKKLFILFTILIFSYAIAQNSEVYSAKNKFGIKKDNVEITPAKYSKLIRLKDNSYIFCTKRKYGIISHDGKILVQPKYNQAQRLVGKYAKLGRNGKYAIFDEYGDKIIDNYSSIDLLYGKMFLVGKNYKYGLVSFNGDIILAPIAQDIYMPDKNTLKIKYEGVWYEIQSKKGEIELGDDILLAIYNDNLNILQIIENPVTSASLGVVSASDYFIKLFSSISPAYEKTIDELVFDYGADTVGVIIKSGWLIKFPFAYSRNYFNMLKASDNGPLSDIKIDLKNKITK